MTKTNPKLLFCDTNCLIILYEGNQARIGRKTRELLSNGVLVISAMSKLELEYLHEVGKIDRPADHVIIYLLNQLNGTIDITPMLQIINEAESITWTRDPFDRLIVANAATLKMPLLTADRNILANYERAVDLQQ